MLNRFPLWKSALIIIVLFFAGLYALPNLYPDDYAVQLSGSRQDVQIDEQTLSRVESVLKSSGIDFKATELQERGGLIRFSDGETQLRGREALAAALGEGYVVALNLAPTTPQWLSDIGAGPMKLGLDLRGGVHFLLEVDMAQAVSQRLDVYVSDIKGNLRKERLRYREVEHRDDGSLSVRFADAATRDELA